MMRFWGKRTMGSRLAESVGCPPPLECQTPVLRQKMFRGRCFPGCLQALLPCETKSCDRKLHPWSKLHGDRAFFNGLWLGSERSDSISQAWPANVSAYVSAIRCRVLSQRMSDAGNLVSVYTQSHQSASRHQATCKHAVRHQGSDRRCAATRCGRSGGTSFKSAACRSNRTTIMLSEPDRIPTPQAQNTATSGLRIRA